MGNRALKTGEPFPMWHATRTAYIRPEGGDAGLPRNEGGTVMPLFMDVHNIKGGVSEADVAGAHAADLAAQDAHGVKYLRYWVNEEAGKIFCLVEAPDAEAANAVHKEAHGLVADEIYPVTEHD
jgi:hypothetical protein